MARTELCPNSLWRKNFQQYNIKYLIFHLSKDEKTTMWLRPFLIFRPWVTHSKPSQQPAESLWNLKKLDTLSWDFDPTKYNVATPTRLPCKNEIWIFLHEKGGRHCNKIKDRACQHMWQCCFFFSHINVILPSSPSEKASTSEIW